MKWFKHDSNANTDAKLKRVHLKYGMAGYGLYWYLLELIASGVDKHNITFELEHDAEIIAHDTGINVELVQEMMSYFVSLNLFENVNGFITCMKMANRTDDYIGRIASDKLRTNYEQTPKKVVVNRIEERRKNIFEKPSIDEIARYCSERANDLDPEKIFNHYEANGWMRGKTKIKDWKACVRTWETNARVQQQKELENNRWQLS